MLLPIALVFSFLTSNTHAADVFLTGSKTFEITEYSVVKKGVSNGNCIQSAPFNVSDHQWAIEVYPQGIYQSSSDYVSVMLRLINPTRVVKAIYTLHWRDWNTGAWSTDTPLYAYVNTFSPNGATAWGYYNFTKRSDLESSAYIRNDTLVVKSTVWVVTNSSAILSTGADVSASESAQSDRTTVELSSEADA